jgi:hypothetical protein
LTAAPDAGTVRRMRTPSSRWTGRRGLFALIATLAIAAALPATAAEAKTKKITCNLDLFAIIPQPAPTAANFGTARCGKPLGKGVQQDSSTVIRSSPTTGVFTGPFRMYFFNGTIRGTFKISFVTTIGLPIPPSTAYRIVGVAYTGTLRVNGGTGAFKRLRGTGKITGTSPDARRTSLNEALTLNGFR